MENDMEVGLQKGFQVLCSVGDSTLAGKVQMPDKWVLGIWRIGILV